MPLEIPLFPLGNVVLLPQGRVPLHVFEPRYRQLTEDALSSDRRIGMIAVRPEHAGEMAGDPPLYAIGCAGFIAEHQRLADGRFQILLHATHRFRVLRERPQEGSRLYRIAEIEALEERLGDESALDRARERVIELIARLDPQGANRAGVDGARLRGLAPGVLAAGIAQATTLPTREKQALLEADSLCERLERLAAALDFHLALRDAVPAGARETLH